jgi:hypothetical protein
VPITRPLAGALIDTLCVSFSDIVYKTCITLYEDFIGEKDGWFSLKEIMTQPKIIDKKELTQCNTIEWIHIT